LASSSYRSPTTILERERGCESLNIHKKE